MKVIRCHHATTRHYLTARDCNRISNEFAKKNYIWHNTVLCIIPDKKYALNGIIIAMKNTEYLFKL